MSGCNFQKEKEKQSVFFYDDCFIFTRSIEPNEVQLIMLHFILAFTVCIISTRIGVSRIQKMIKRHKIRLNR